MRTIVFILGILFILLAVLADRIGLDHNPSWGTSRYLLFTSGLTLVLISGLIHLFKTVRITKGAQRKLAAVIDTVVRQLKRVQQSRRVSAILTVILLAGISSFAIWYTSIGLFPIFKTVLNPYVDLGEAFIHGQVALLQEPDPQFLALANPYDYEAREKVPYLWDISYYQGKYYLYWGPVPALFFAFVQGITRIRPPDQMMVIFSYLGLGIVLSTLLLKIQKWYFPHAPGLSAPLFLLAGLVNIPYMFILGRCQVYETSIITGQFFLFLGLLAWLFYLNNHQWPWLSLAGLGWGFAVGSRYNLAISASVFLAFALLSIWRDAGADRSRWKQAAALLSPVLICGLGLAVYNAARFGNPLETGLIYQLTIPVYENRHFSPGFILSNLYMYLFYPMVFRPSFPFIPAIPIQYNHLPAWAAFPKGRFSEDVFYGVFPALPVLWVLVVQIPILILASAWKRIKRKVRERLPTEGTRQRRQIAGILALAGLLQFAFLLFYYYGAMRFNVDYYLLVLLAIYFLTLELDETLRGLAALRFLFWLASALLILATAGYAVLAGFDIPPQVFRINNPPGFYAIVNRANQIFSAFQALADDPGVAGMLIRGLFRIIPFR